MPDWLIRFCVTSQGSIIEGDDILTGDVDADIEGLVDSVGRMESYLMISREHRWDKVKLESTSIISIIIKPVE